MSSKKNVTTTKSRQSRQTSSQNPKSAARKDPAAYASLSLFTCQRTQQYRRSHNALHHETEKTLSLERAGTAIWSEEPQSTRLRTRGQGSWAAGASGAPTNAPHMNSPPSHVKRFKSGNSRRRGQDSSATARHMGSSTRRSRPQADDPGRGMRACVVRAVDSPEGIFTATPHWGAAQP